MRTILALAIVALALTACCASTKEAAPAQTAYTLVMLKTGPNSGQLSEAENRAAFDGHFSNMARLASEHKLVVAGPYGKTRHDESLRGLFVINSAVRAEATEWAGTDPTTRAGVFIQEFHDFATDAPLVAMLERVLENDAKAIAEGRKPKPGEGARPYVLLHCSNYDDAYRELTPLMKGGGVLMFAKVDGATACALLDAKDVTEARDRFGPVLVRLEQFELDDWFATDQLEHMSEL